MTDTGIADTLNRRVAQLITKRLDLVDWIGGVHLDKAWWTTQLADALSGDNLHATDGDRAWLVGLLPHPRRRLRRAPGRLRLGEPVLTLSG